MLYFLSTDIAHKLNYKSHKSLFKTYNLVKGRHYIRITYATHPRAYKRLLQLGLVESTAPVLLCTIMGVMEIVFKTKKYELNTGVRIQDIKDSFILEDKHDLLMSETWLMMNEIVNRLPIGKRAKFFRDYRDAMIIMKEEIGVVNDEIDRCVKYMRYLYTAEIGTEIYNPGLNISALSSNFKCFVL